MSEQRIGRVVVAFNAASTLAAVLDRIPETFLARVMHTYVTQGRFSLSRRNPT